MDQNQDKLIFFHVGMPKTASTFLQLKVFPKFKGIDFIKKHDFKRKDKLIQQSDYDRILLSIELDLDRKGGMNHMIDVANRYPDTYPVIVLRKQGSWLSSKYKYYLRKHGAKKFNEYFDPNSENSEMSVKNLEFFPKIELLRKHFNKRPLVLFQEELKHAPFKVIDLLADFTGVEYDKNDIKIKTVKKAYSEKQLKLVRQFNRFHHFDKSKISSKTKRFILKKWSALLLHTVAYLGAVIPERNTEPLIPKNEIKFVNEKFEDDWQKCIDFAKETREVYLPQ